jgi:hypothetical protein
VPGVKGAGDELEKLDAEMKEHLGGDDTSAQEYYEQRRKEIQDKVLSAATKVQEATNEVYKKLSDQLFENGVHEPWWARVAEGGPEFLKAYGTTTTDGDKVSIEKALQELTEKLGGKAETTGVMGVPVRSTERQQAINLLRDARANDWSSGDTGAAVRYDSTLPGRRTWRRRSGWCRRMCRGWTARPGL